MWTVINEDLAVFGARCQRPYDITVINLVKSSFNLCSIHKTGRFHSIKQIQSKFRSLQKPVYCLTGKKIDKQQITKIK